MLYMIADEEERSLYVPMNGFELTGPLMVRLVFVPIGMGGNKTYGSPVHATKEGDMLKFEVSAFIEMGLPSGEYDIEVQAGTALLGVGTDEPVWKTISTCLQVMVSPNTNVSVKQYENTIINGQYEEFGE